MEEKVEGLAWMDHEKMTNESGTVDVGWDWCSLQLGGGEELMVFTCRIAGRPGLTCGTFVARDGRSTALRAEDLEIVPAGEWRSGRSGVRYPVRWRLRVRPLGLALGIEPRVEGSEIDATRSAGMVYWEGAVRARGTRGGQPVEGHGFLELVGYDRRARARWLYRVVRSVPPREASRLAT